MPVLFSFSVRQEAIKFLLYTFETDIDECAIIPGACKNGRCLNTMGSFRCVCDKGYKTDIDGKKCIGKVILLCFLVLLPALFRLIFFYSSSQRIYQKSLLRLSAEDTKY